MKNPCKNCIVKCNCTQICEDKQTYGKSIETKTAKLYFLSSDASIEECKNNFKEYLKYEDLYEKNRGDKIAIINRRMKRRFPN